jgi:intein-encoded DNA endonuclease-like protein
MVTEFISLLDRISQVELKQQIEVLSEELKKISESQECILDIDVYVRKLVNAKLKVTVVSNILQAVQVKLTELLDAEVLKLCQGLVSKLNIHSPS